MHCQYIVYLLFCLSIALIACEDISDSTIDIEIPATKNRIVVNTEISLEADSVQLLFSHSQNITDFSPLQDLSSLEVTLKIQDQVIPLRSARGYRTGPGRINPDPTKPLVGRLEAKHPLFETIYSETAIAPKPIVTSVKFDLDGAKDEFGEDLGEITIELSDDPAIQNYYAVSAYTFVPEKDTISSDTIFDHLRNRQVNFFPDGFTSFAGIGDNIIFSDMAFSGGTYKVRLPIDRHYEVSRGDRVMLVLIKSITGDRYQFEKSVGNYIANEGNPFVEPQNIHTNIENGYGIFSIEQSVEMEAEIE